MLDGKTTSLKQSWANRVYEVSSRSNAAQFSRHLLPVARERERNFVRSTLAELFYSRPRFPFFPAKHFFAFKMPQMVLNAFNRKLIQGQAASRG